MKTNFAGIDDNSSPRGPMAGEVKRPQSVQELLGQNSGLSGFYQPAL
jgi:hypothetical protein